MTPVSPPSTSADFDLRLYVAGQTTRSVAAMANLRRLCEAYLPGRYHLEIIDLLTQPQRARADQIVAVPTLVRAHPEPVRKVLGDLSDTSRVLAGLGLPVGSVA